MITFLVGPLSYHTASGRRADAAVFKWAVVDDAKAKSGARLGGILGSSMTRPEPSKGATSEDLRSTGFGVGRRRSAIVLFALLTEDEAPLAAL